MVVRYKKGRAMTFESWLAKVDEIGIREGVFDSPAARFLCPGTLPRRPYAGRDGIFFELFESGVPAELAIGEALAAD
jgi:hypothetical protein